MGATRIFVDGNAGVVGRHHGGRRPRESFMCWSRGFSATASPPCSRSRPAPRPRASTVPEESIADTVIRLRMEDAHRATFRSIEIVKSRGHAFQMGRHCFRIVDRPRDRGLPARAGPARRRDTAAAFDPTTRVTTGVPGLDPP